MKDYKKYFEKHILKTYDPSLLKAVDDYFQSLEEDVKASQASSNLLDERMAFSAYFLSLIKVLEKRGTSDEVIEAFCLEIVEDYIKPKNVLTLQLKKLPVLMLRLGFAKRTLQKMNAGITGLGYDGGFRGRIITKKDETYGLGYGIDILECGICKLFKKYGAEDKVHILCKVDHMTTSMTGLTLIRTSTIADGSDKCDFRFKMKK